MKIKICYYLVFAIFFPGFIYAQTFNGDLTLTTQAQVDAFNYTEVTGNLTIDDQPDGNITNVNGLSELTTIGGGLTIDDNNSLSNIDSLANLTSVKFIILNRNGITDVEGLSGVTHLNRPGNFALRINFNTSLTNIDGLSNLMSVDGHIGIEDNMNLTNLDGLSNLTSVTSLSIGGNFALISISGLANVSVSGSIFLSGNKALPNLNGFPNISTVNHEIIIQNNDALTNVDGLSVIQAISNGGALSIHLNDSITNIDGLSNLATMNGILIIQSNGNLANIDGLLNLTTIGGSFLLGGAVLTNINGLSNVTYAKQLRIGATAITNLNALSKLDSAGNLIIIANPALSNIDSLINLHSLEQLIIGNNSTLGNLDGLLNLTSVKGALEISGNHGLTNLNGLSNLDSVFALQISTNNNLTDISALLNLSYIGNKMQIFNNNKLTNIDAFINITGAVPGIEIDGNSSLTSLFGLSNIHSASTVIIRNNAVLTNVDGLSGLFQAQLLIQHNISLININGLSNFTSGRAAILENTSLSEFCGLFNYVSVNSNPVLLIANNAVNPTAQGIKEGGPCSAVPTARSFITVLLGSNEYYPVETDASGGGMFVLNAAQDTLEFWIRLCDIECPLIAADFNLGTPGKLGTIVKNITSSFAFDTVGNDTISWFAHGFWTNTDSQTLSPALVAQLLSGNIFLNIHTSDHPAGKIRGQLTRNIPVDLFAKLDGSQETPPVMTMGLGEGHFTLSGDGDSLWYQVMIGNLSGPVAASHFHKAAFGVPGPVVRGISFAGDSLSEGVWTNMDAQPLTPVLVADLLGCFLYVNVHTQQHPAGEIRGQIYKTEHDSAGFMTIWAAENDQDPNQNSKLNFYSLAEGNQFLNYEGEIYGYTGEKRIVDLTIDIGGNIYFLNNTWTSMIYRIKASAIDLDGSTPVYARQIGRTRTFPDDKLVWISHIQFIRGKLYGLDNKTNKLYEVNPYNAYVKEIIELSTPDKKASGFALGADGNVYLLKALDGNRSEIWKFEDFPGNSLTLVTGISSLDMLESFASHPNGKLYASDKNNLYEIDLSQRTVGVLEDHQVNISAMDFDTYTEKNAEAVSTIKFTDVTGVTAVDRFTELPTEYSLSQNYPNPFNPGTTIKYQLPEAAFVKLNVYNALGELVRTLVSESKNAGYYEISFDASSLSSGMYIYKLEAGSFVSTSKMILLK